MQKANPLDAFKNWMIANAPSNFKNRDYARAWLAGEIDSEEYIKRNREELEKDNVKASGTWWPKYLMECGAIEITGGEVSFVVIGHADIHEKNEKGGNTGKVITIPVFHRELMLWLRGEQRKEKADVQFAGIIQDQPAEEEKWISELF